VRPGAHADLLPFATVVVTTRAYGCTPLQSTVRLWSPSQPPKEGFAGLAPVFRPAVTAPV